MWLWLRGIKWSETDFKWQTQNKTICSRWLKRRNPTRYKSKICFFSGKTRFSNSKPNRRFWSHQNESTSRIPSNITRIHNTRTKLLAAWSIVTLSTVQTLGSNIRIKQYDRHMLNRTKWSMMNKRVPFWSKCSLIFLKNDPRLRNVTLTSVWVAVRQLWSFSCLKS